MKIVTYLILEKGEIFAMTADEHKAAGGIPADWDDFVWQDQPDKATAIARHDDALDAFVEDCNAGRPIKEVY